MGREEGEEEKKEGMDVVFLSPNTRDDRMCCNETKVDEIKE